MGLTFEPRGKAACAVPDGGRQGPGGLRSSDMSLDPSFTVRLGT